MENTYINKPFWTSINKVPYIYPWLSHDESSQACIMGGGINGALCCLKFISSGIDTILISAEPIASSATSKSYGTIQLHYNKGLYSLSKNIGITKAIKVYNLLKKSIDEIENICLSLDNPCGFKRGNSFLFTREKNNNELLQKEYMLLKHNGFDVKFITKNEALEKFPFKIESGILFNNLAATVDPYLLTHEIIKKCESLGARIYENSKVEKIGINHDIPYLVTSTGQKIKTESIISTIGENVCNLFNESKTKRTSFAIVTEPLENSSCLDDTCLISCIDRPQINFSSTKDKRIIAYGLDAGIVDPFRKLSGISKTSINKFDSKKFDSLSEGLSYYFPGLYNSSTKYAFATDYIQTETGLPILGSLKEFKDCFYSFCPGENGIPFSNITANMLLNMHKNDSTQNCSLFNASL